MFSFCNMQRSLNGANNFSALIGNALLKYANLGDLTDTNAARTNLGLTGNLNSTSSYVTVTPYFNLTQDSVISVNASTNCVHNSLVAYDGSGNIKFHGLIDSQGFSLFDIDNTGNGWSTLNVGKLSAINPAIDCTNSTLSNINTVRTNTVITNNLTISIAAMNTLKVQSIDYYVPQGSGAVPPYTIPVSCGMSINGDLSLGNYDLGCFNVIASNIASQNLGVTSGLSINQILLSTDASCNLLFQNMLAVYPYTTTQLAILNTSGSLTLSGGIVATYTACTTSWGLNQWFVNNDSSSNMVFNYISSKLATLSTSGTFTVSNLATPGTVTCNKLVATNIKAPLNFVNTSGTVGTIDSSGNITCNTLVSTGIQAPLFCVNSSGSAIATVDGSGNASFNNLSCSKLQVPLNLVTITGTAIATISSSGVLSTAWRTLYSQTLTNTQGMPTTGTVAYPVSGNYPFIISFLYMGTETNVRLSSVINITSGTIYFNLQFWQGSTSQGTVTNYTLISSSTNIMLDFALPTLTAGNNYYFYVSYQKSGATNPSFTMACTEILIK